MFRHTLALVALVAASASVLPAQQQDSSAAGRCATPDTIVVTGNSRVSNATVLADAGLAPRVTLNYRVLQRAIRDLYATSQYDDVRIDCGVAGADGRSTLVIALRERLVLSDVAVVGPKQVSARSVKDRVELLIGRPIDPAQITRAVTRIDSLYEAQGYYLVRVRPETTLVADGRAKLTFRVEEGNRLAVSGIRIGGNAALTDKEVAGAMQTRPEGFWFFRPGEFDEDKYAADIAERIPGRYARDGFVDFQILKDTLVIDRERGKALVDITVSEGTKYKVGSFEVVGNRRFNTEEIARFYPFTTDGATISERVMGVVRRRRLDGGGAFDRGRWEEATGRVRSAYANEGYIYATVRPVVERAGAGPDSVPVVNLRWEINEETPAIINRIDIAGNDYTTDHCIRDQLVILPGDVFNQDRLIRSYQNIGNLNFFETPLVQPDVRPTANGRDVDILFNVKEKRTGNINFGASAGQGTGLGGFLGVDQPNVFGQCKRISAQIQYGAGINNFSLSYTDPAVRQSRVSGTATAYRSQARYNIGGLGRQTSAGGSLQFGFPIPQSPFTRVFVSYGGESVQFGNSGLLGRDVATANSNNSFRSTLGVSATHDTRIDLPFATAGGLQTVSAQFNGGPLGGSAKYQRYTTELRSYAPLGQFGGKKPGSQPVKFVLGLTGRVGTVFGGTGPFFSSQTFTLGGVQFGEQLRGYGEFCIGPDTIRASNGGQCSAQRTSFGSAYLTTTTELGMRVNQQFYVNAFMDAGNVWNEPQQINPARLVRGAGVGVAVISPLGPLGLDFAYGFDRRKLVDGVSVPAPGWQLHFKLGNLF